MEKRELNLFRTVKNTNEKFVIVTGGIQASNKEFKTRKEAQAYIDEKPWELIFALIIAVKESEKTTEQEANKENKE